MPEIRPFDVNKASRVDRSNMSSSATDALKDSEATLGANEQLSFEKILGTAMKTMDNNQVDPKISQINSFVEEAIKKYREEEASKKDNPLYIDQNLMNGVSRSLASSSTSEFDPTKDLYPGLLEN